MSSYVQDNLTSALQPEDYIGASLTYALVELVSRVSFRLGLRCCV